MRKLFILTGLLVILGSLALISANHRELQVHREKQTEKGKAAVINFGYDHHVPSPEKPVTPGNLSIEEKNRQQYIQKFNELKREEQNLESVCNECRALLERASIDDSVYDQYDNPEGRLQRYSIDKIVGTLMKSSRRLWQNRQEQARLKQQYF